MTTDMEKLVIAEREFNSRLFLGTGKFNSDEVMEQSSCNPTEMVTVAMKRIELDNKEDNMLVHIQHPGIQLCPTPPVCAMPKKLFLLHRWRVKLSARNG